MKLKSKKTTGSPGDRPPGDGQTDWSRTPVEATQSWPPRVAVAHEDITARKLAEEKLRKSEERYRAFVEQSSEAIWRVELREPLDPTLPIDEQIEHFYRHAYLAECNDVMARMYGYERGGEITGAALGDLVPRIDQANIEYL